jgi:RPA family protein
MKCPSAFIELIEEVDEEVRYSRERYYIENTDNCVNKIKKLERTNNEKKEYMKQYYKLNKEKMDQATAEWINKNSEKRRLYMLEYKKEWRRRLKLES